VITVRGVFVFLFVAGFVVTCIAWGVFVIERARLPWHIRWDLKPYPSNFQVWSALLPPPQWLDEKGIWIRRIAHKALIVALIGLLVVAIAALVLLFASAVYVRL